MKLSEYKQLLDTDPGPARVKLLNDLEQAALTYLQKTGTKVRSVTALELKEKFVVFEIMISRTENEIRALSIWSLIEDAKQGCKSCARRGVL